jgi:hypothetical protein
MKKIFKYTSLLLVILLMGSCEEFLDVNEDPNNPVSVTPDLILPVGQVYTANIIHGNTGRRANCLGNMLMYNWSQSDGYSWYTDEFKYNVTSSFYQAIFNDSYSTALKQYQILDQMEDTKYDNYKAIAKVMKSYHFQLLVDLYGDVPYSEALQRSSEATPKYDDAQTIYEDLITQLDTAIMLINNAEVTAVVPGTDDTMFGGDMDEWKKFANSVKLRILIRQSSMSGRDAYIKTELDKIAAEGSGYITSDVGINPGYVKEQDKQNPMWNYFGYDASGTITMDNNATCASDFILQHLTTTTDPRIDRLYEKPAAGHLGVPQGLLDYDTPVVDKYIAANVSNIGPGILKGPDQDAVIYTLAECYFNLAEARQKGLITTGDDAKTLYEKGIQASFDYLEAEGAEAYYSQVKNLVSWNSSTNKLEAIITQKWIAVNGITAEQSWFDYNRTGYPSNLPISLESSKADRPVRIFYPAGEYSSNGENIPTQPDAFTDKIFWGK